MGLEGGAGFVKQVGGARGRGGLMGEVGGVVLAEKGWGRLSEGASGPSPIPCSWPMVSDDAAWWRQSLPATGRRAVLSRSHSCKPRSACCSWRR